ncbi:MAG: hypothetical protein A2X49_05585 [Lentisphaerae bacterium GWF2_52_8]|nr:MAG: hypothetical protein A2X49_05585 [Lentisphaerae bacterium GWF2_52_8]
MIKAGDFLSCSKLLIGYLSFAALYSFVLIDHSFYLLSGDNLTLGSLVLPQIHPDIFSNDLAKLFVSSYYLPVFTSFLTWLCKLSGTYTLALQMMLFLILWATLLSTHWMLRGLFQKTKTIVIIAFTLLLSMSFVLLPSGEIIGFGGLHSTLARYLFGIFLPLLILFWYKHETVSLWGHKISSLVPIGAVLGLLVSVHPQSAIISFFVIGVHWTICRASWKKNWHETINTVLCGGFCFAICMASYAYPYVVNVYLDKKPILGEKSLNLNIEEISKKIEVEFGRGIKEIEDKYGAEALSNTGLKGIRNFFFYKIRWDAVYQEFFFLPFLIPFLLLLLWPREEAPTWPDPDLWRFLKALFLIGFLINIAGSFLQENILMGPLFLAFKRMDRLLFFILELMGVYFLFYGKALGLGQRLRWVLSFAMLFYWLTLTKTHCRFQYDFLAKIWPGHSLSLTCQTLIFNFVIAVIFCSLLLFYRFSLQTRAISKSLMAWFLIASFLSWPFFSGGIITAAGFALDSLNGIGSWSLVAKFTRSQAADRIKSFDETAVWVRANLAKDVRCFFLDDNAHALKLACLRSGLGDKHEIGINQFRKKILKFRECIRAKNIASGEGILSEMGVRYVVADAALAGDAFKSPDYEERYRNRLYVVYEKCQEKGSQ